MEQNKSISKLRRLTIFGLLSIFTISFFTNCTEKPLLIDPDEILPDDDMLNVLIDSIPVELYTVSLEALETRSVGISPLGCVNDTVVGIAEMDFISDFIYTDEVSFKSNLYPDSLDILDLTIELEYITTYGDSMDVNFDVYELYEPMPNYTRSDYVLFSHMYDPEPVNEGPPVKGRLSSDADDTIAIYSVKLNNEFAERFIDTTLIHEGIYESNNQRKFKSYFKGFYFAVQPREEKGGGIIMVDHFNSTMNLRTLEWNGDSARWDTITNYFSLGNPDSEIDSGGIHLNLYRSISNTKLERILNDTVNIYGSAYVQALTGPKVYIKLPTIDDMRDSLNNRVSVNRAQLILPFDPVIFDRDKELYPPPSNLGIYDSKTNSAIIDDALAENHLGGSLDTNNYQYVLNIGNHIHGYLRNDTSSFSNAFYLFAAKGSPVTYLEYTPARVVLNGSTSSRPPFVRIIYSIIPE